MLEVERQLPFIVHPGFLRPEDPLLAASARHVSRPSSELEGRLRAAVHDANLRFFGVELADDVEWTLLAPTEIGTEWGWGLGPGAKRRRKLVALLALSSQEPRGGELLLFDQHFKTVPLAPGDLAIFPSYMQHRWTPLASGRRTFLEGWFHGTPWH